MGKIDHKILNMIDVHHLKSFQFSTTYQILCYKVVNLLAILLPSYEKSQSVGEDSAWLVPKLI